MNYFDHNASQGKPQPITREPRNEREANYQMRAAAAVAGADALLAALAPKKLRKE